MYPPRLSHSRGGRAQAEIKTVHKGLSGRCGQARNGQPCGRSREATSLLSFPDVQEETSDTSAMGERDQLIAGGRRLQGAEPPACKRMLLHRE